MDIRLQTEPFSFDGKVYRLRCNMNVLADVQEHYGGDLQSALSGKYTRSALVFLTAMLNDYADEMGWPLFNDKEVGRLLSVTRLAEVREKVTRLVSAAVQPTPDADEKNAKATRNR